MKNQNSLYTFSLFILTLLLAGFAFSGFKSSSSSQSELLTITVTRDQDRVLIDVSQSGKVLEKTVYLDPNQSSRYNAIKRMSLNNGIKVEDKSLGAINDYRVIYPVIQEYLGDGWKIISHGYGAKSYDDISNDYVTQYLLVR